METMDKSTVEYDSKKIEMFQSLMKTGENKYLAVLSDNSMDRDGEIVGQEALSKIASADHGQIAILLNHENKIENLIGEWTNRRLENIDGHTALVAEPKFYMSNPKAAMIKGLLDDGAQCGISIGAMVKSSEQRKINNKSVNVYTELELVEASFVAIPSNRHGMAMALAKKFGKKLDEESKVTEEKTYSEKEYLDLLAEKANLEAEIAKLQTPVVEEVVKAPEELVEEAIVEVKSEDSDLRKEIDALKEDYATVSKLVEELKNKKPVLKAVHDTPEGNEYKAETQKSGIPIIRR